MKIVAGIDPGLDGGVAVLNEADLLETATLPTMGEGTQRILDGGALARWLVDRDVNYAVVERAQAMRKLRGSRESGDDESDVQGVASSFRYGVSYGQIIGVLQTLLIPYETIHPLTWKRRYGLLNDKKAGKVVAKDDSRRKAIELFPRSADLFVLKKSVHCAEAALLARYALQGGST